MLFRRARFFGAILVVSLGVPFSAFAEDLSCPVPPADPLIKLLSPPPCDSCAETKAELEELQTLQRSRSDAEAKHALADYDISLSRFLDGAEIKFDATALGKCIPFFDKLAARTKEAAEHGKSAFCRTRPFNLPDSGLTPVQAIKNTPSYPSGHTTYGTLIAAVLGQMIPEKRGEFYARAADYGHSRMVAGVHFRRDVEAGKVLGSWKSLPMNSPMTTISRRHFRMRRRVSATHWGCPRRLEPRGVACPLRLLRAVIENFETKRLRSFVNASHC